jgi:mRNA interferase MazF
MIPEPRRGDIWLADLDKRRPVVVLTRDPLGSYLHSVLVGPITSTIRGLSVEVPVGLGDGIRRASVVNLDNMQLIDRTALVRQVGIASAQTMERICSAAVIAIGCDR